jgi:hypothetical protein
MVMTYSSARAAIAARKREKRARRVSTLRIGRFPFEIGYQLVPDEPTTGLS